MGVLRVDPDRKCPCGALAGGTGRRQYCDACADKRKRIQNRESMIRRRAAQRRGEKIKPKRKFSSCSQHELENLPNHARCIRRVDVAPTVSDLQHMPVEKLIRLFTQ